MGNKNDDSSGRMVADLFRGLISDNSADRGNGEAEDRPTELPKTASRSDDDARAAIGGALEDMLKRLNPAVLDGALPSNNVPTRSSRREDAGRRTAAPNTDQVGELISWNPPT